METTNLLISKRPDILRKLFRTYSTNENDRVNLVKTILNAEDPFNINVSDSSDSEATINKKILDKYLEILDLKIETDEDLE